MKQTDNLFGRILFRRLFFSYILLIFLCMSFYSVTLLYENNTITKERVEQKADLMLEETERIVRERMITAESTVTELNYSAVLKKLYLSKVAGNTDDTYNFTDIQDEIARNKIINGLDISSIMIFLDGDRSVYTSSGKITVGEQAFEMGNPELPVFRVGTVQDLLGLQDSKRYSFRKEYLIYADYYTYQNGKRIGIICILFDLDAMKKDVERVLMPQCGVNISIGDQEVFSTGIASGTKYSMESTVIPEMMITLHVARGALKESNMLIYVILAVIIVVSLLFILIAYLFSKRNYRVIGDIEQLVQNEHGASEEKRSAEEETQYILHGIEKMIVERNGYQEKMITISPYAKAGMLQGMLSGNLSNNAVKILKEEKYLNLIKPYFVVVAVDIMYSGERTDQDAVQIRLRSEFEKVCQTVSSEEIKAVYYYQNINTVLLIINSDTDEIPDEYFYGTHRFLRELLSELGCQVTLGVDAVRNDIGELKEAYESALQILNHIMLDGRDMVYFRDMEDETEEKYYFPGNFKDRLLKAFRKKQEEEITLLLDEIYRKNMQKGGSVRMYQKLTEELYISIVGTVKEYGENSMLHMTIEQYAGRATLEEIFAYYKAALISIMEVQTEEGECRDEGELEEEIVQFIEQNYCNPEMSMQMVCDTFKVNIKYLGLLCKRRYQMNYLQYLQKRRIDKAVELLNEGKYSLGQICEMCGYSSQLTFRRNFKALTGVNPSYYGDKDSDSESK